MSRRWYCRFAVFPDGFLTGTDCVAQRGPSISVAQGLARGAATEASFTPDQVEGVALRAAIGVLNPDDGCAAFASGVLDQLLSSAPIDVPKLKVSSDSWATARNIRTGAIVLAVRM